MIWQKYLLYFFIIDILKWKLTDTTLENKASEWTSSDKWEFVDDGNGIKIKNKETEKYFGATSTDAGTSVTTDSDESLIWMKGDVDADGFFELKLCSDETCSNDMTLGLIATSATTQTIDTTIKYENDGFLTGK